MALNQYSTAYGQYQAPAGQGAAAQYGPMYPQAGAASGQTSPGQLSSAPRKPRQAPTALNSQAPQPAPAYPMQSAPQQPGPGTINYTPGGAMTQAQTTPASGQTMAPSVTADNGQPLGTWNQQPNDPNTIETPQGWDFSTPGVGEQYFDYAMQQQHPTPTNQAAGAYSNFLNTQPADLNPYYDAARTRFTNATNQQLAARGTYGSSVGEGQLMTGLGNLNAQQAKDEADYGLQRNSLGGTLASSSDRSSLAGSQDQMAYLNALGQLAGNAQDQRRARGRDYMSDVMGLTGAAVGTAQGGYNNLLQDDQSLFGNQENLYTGQGTVQQQQGANDTANNRQDWSQALATALAFM